MTIHYMDGSQMKVEFPVQAPNENAQVIKLKEALAARHMIVEADGALLIIPSRTSSTSKPIPRPRSCLSTRYARRASPPDDA